MNNGISTSVTIVRRSRRISRSSLSVSRPRRDRRSCELAWGRSGTTKRGGDHEPKCERRMPDAYCVRTIVLLVLPESRSGNCLNRWFRRKTTNTSILHTVDQQFVLVAQEKLAAGDYVVRPCRAAAPFGLLELPQFAVTCRRGFHEGHRAPFAADNQTSVGERQRSLADAAVLPLHLSGLQLDAEERLIGGGVDVPVVKHQSSVMHRQIVGVPGEPARRLATAGRQLDHRASLAVTRCRDHHAVVRHGRATI